MDELLRDFLAETSESIGGIETQIVQFERDPANGSLVSGIFRLVHTIKGTAGFLGLERLQTLAHSAENLLGDLRDGVPPTPGSVSLILSSIDRIKEILRDIEALGSETAGEDSELIALLEAEIAANGHRAVNEQMPPAAKPLPLRQGELNKSDEAAEADQEDFSATSEAASADVEHKPTTETYEKRRDNTPSRKAEEQVQVKGGRSASSAAETIRVTVDTIDRIMQLVSELVLTRNQLIEITRNRENDPIKLPLQRLSGLTTDLQDAVMRARMQPIGRLFANLPRLMRELSSDLNKKINLVTEGADTELDRQLIEALRDPLTHIIRNCADHGIETPQERVAAGKPEAGEVRISASHEAGQITIAIADDGRGLNLDRIKEKAVAEGLVTQKQADALSTDELCRFIFAPGFSTAEKVTSVSGRGVGMDVVRSNIESIGGGISLSTVPGDGSCFSLKIPLTLAIAPALIVRVGKERFALPQTAVVEAVRVGSNSRHIIEKIQGGLVLRLRDEVVPVIDLSSALSLTSAPREVREDRLVVIIRIGSDTFGVRVDDVIDVQEIVVKPLNASLSDLKMFTGQTILGDGSVVLILDPSGIGKRLGIEKTGAKKLESAREDHSGRDLTRLVLFRAGDGLPKVLPLSLLSRIEMVDADRIKKSDGRYVMIHQGKLIPLLPTSPTHEIGDKGHPVLVITANGHTLGLLVDEIIDIVEDHLSIQLPSFVDDVVGAAEIRGEAVDMLDVSYYLQAAYSVIYQQESANILLVDDDPLLRDTLKSALVSAGHRVETVGSAAEVNEIMEHRNDFDAALIDAEMKAEKGRSLTDHLRSKELVPSDFPLFRLHAMPAHKVVGLTTNDPNTINLSKLDRQGLLGTLALVLARCDRNGTSKELAA